MSDGGGVAPDAAFRRSAADEDDDSEAAEESEAWVSFPTGMRSEATSICDWVLLLLLLSLTSCMDSSGGDSMPDVIKSMSLTSDEKYARLSAVVFMFASTENRSEPLVADMFSATLGEAGMRRLGGPSSGGVVIPGRK
jgi:hypothetical protein